MSLPLTSVLLEDEDLALRALRRCVSHHREIEIIGHADNVDDAFLLFQKYRPQTAFMDIKLIGGSAFQLLQRLQRSGLPIPAIVLVSAFPREAVVALNEYREYVVHFIEKPYLENWEDTFRRAVDDLLAFYPPDIVPEKAYTLLKTNESIERIPQASIVWAEVLPRGRSCVVTDDGHYDVNLTLSRLLETHPEMHLQQCSREYAINVNRVLRVLIPTREAVIRFRDGEKIFPIGKSYFGDLMDRL